MPDARKITDNVFAFLDKAAKDYGKLQEHRFSQNLHCQLVEKLQSPIEDLFFIACHVLCESELVSVNPEPEFPTLPNGKFDVNNWTPGRGVVIRPQAKIGQYRVDFLLEQHGLGPDDICSPVIVELDGHDFHDKDKHQRSYEKARDRFLVKQKYRVLHFTGSDIVTDPYKAAYEVLELVGVFIDSFREGYDPEDPLGLK